MAKLLDTHQHLIYREHLTYAWSDNAPALSGQDFTVQDYQRLSEGHDVAGTIFMEVDVSEDLIGKETHLVADLAKDPANKILGIISSCRPEKDDGFEAWLDECADLPVVGFRRILHEIDDDLSKSEGFRANVRKIGARNKTFDMCFRADQLSIAAELSKACDDMTLVLDHCGVPNIAGGEFDSWKAGITAIAALPHVNCKVSGILAYCAEGNATREAIEPYVAHVIDSFGFDRLLFGSDWPVVNLRSDLPNWLTLFRQLIGDVSEVETNAICHLNAQRIYGVSL